MQSLTIAKESQLFGSVVRALYLYLGRPSLNPTIGGIFFSAMFHSFVTAFML